MGQSLPKAVTSIVLEEDAGPLFRLGSAEMNGHRPAMEDAHVALMRDTWGFFGVFDGHGGQQCSTFVARRLTEELSKMDLPDNDAVKSLMLRIDTEFLDTKQPSGSTGTFALAIPSTDGKTVELRVGNIGDSRVLLSRADGTMVEGPGTDGGLTTDHKPDHPVEVERIQRTGGTVQTIMGVPRVNGDLAVSRAFGDAQHKKTGGPKQEDHPVSVEPEFTTLSCDRTDFLILVCDGISEGNFPNREVVQLAAEELKSKEPAQAAASVCRRALDRGSMDNLSCMIVCFDGKTEKTGRIKDLVPGPFTEPAHGGFRKAYAAMAERAGVSLEAAVERRYDAARKLDEEASRAHSAKENGDAKSKEENGQSLAKMLWPMRSMEQGEEGTDVALKELRSELQNFGSGPPAKLTEGSNERTAWFKEWLDGTELEGGKDPSTMTREELLSWAEEDPQVLAMAKAQGWLSQRAMRRVRIVDAEKLRPAIEAHEVIQWDDRLLSVCGQVGKVLQDDESDGTSQVKFRGKVSASVWLPLDCLIDEEDDPPRKVQVAPLEVLKAAIEEHPMLTWKDGMENLADQVAIAIKDEQEFQLTEVRFPPPLSLRRYLPNSVLQDLEGPVGDIPIEEIDSTESASDSDDDMMMDLEDAGALRDAYIPSMEKVKAAIQAFENFEWEESLEWCLEQKGEVLMDYPSGLSCLRVADGLVWLPTCALEEINDSPAVAEEAEKGEKEEAAVEGETNDSENSSKRPRTS